MYYANEPFIDRVNEQAVALVILKREQWHRLSASARPLTPFGDPPAHRVDQSRHDVDMKRYSLVIHRRSALLPNRVGRTKYIRKVRERCNKTHNILACSYRSFTKIFTSFLNFCSAEARSCVQVRTKCGALAKGKYLE